VLSHDVDSKEFACHAVATNGKATSRGAPSFSLPELSPGLKVENASVTFQSFSVISSP
jgi:hypothetical protein